jgi:phosphoglycolate phosphatase-like HAD superfamily hydrolase
MTRLVLFDIDGTLVLTGGAGQRAIVRAFASELGVTDALGDIPLAGRTDRAILEDVIDRFALGAVHEPARLERLARSYLGYLEAEMQVEAPGKAVLPGVRDVLDRLAPRDDVHLALLTGNLEDGARIKLGYFGLWDYFRFGAFGGHTRHRAELLTEALDRARAHGVVPSDPASVVVIGDTPHDIDCAKSGGATAIAVATGPYDTATLRSHGADFVFEDLSDTAAVLDAIGA